MAEPTDPAEPTDEPIDEPIDEQLRASGARVAERALAATGSPDLGDLQLRGRRQRRVVLARLATVTAVVLVIVGTGLAFSLSRTGTTTLETAGSIPSAPTTVPCTPRSCGAATSAPVVDGTVGSVGTPTTVPSEPTSTTTPRPPTTNTTPVPDTTVPTTIHPTTVVTPGPPTTSSSVDCGTIAYASGWPTTIRPNPAQVRCIVDAFDAGTTGTLVTREQTDGNGGHILIRTYHVSDRSLLLITDASGAEPPGEVTAQRCRGLTASGVDLVVSDCQVLAPP